MPTFITNAQMLDRYDSRRVADMLLDDYTAATLADMLDPLTVAGARLAEMISDASELILSAATVSARYSLNDLTTYGGKQLVRLTADLAWGLVLGRRALATEDFAKQAPFYAGAADQLEALRQGERIFYAVPNVPEAGLPATATTAPTPGLQPPLLTQLMVPLVGSTNQPQGPRGSWA